MGVAANDLVDLMPFERLYILPKNVSAIQILPAEDGGRTRLGLITQLPEGAEIDFGGPGFNERTVQIRYQGSSYFVFVDELELVRKHAVSAMG